MQRMQSYFLVYKVRALFVCVIYVETCNMCLHTIQIKRLICALLSHELTYNFWS